MNNVYGSVSVPPNTPTVVAGITVPQRAGYSFKGFVIWSDIDCEVEVKFNVQTIGGGRISGANQTLIVDYDAAPYGMNPGDMVAVLATQMDSVAHDVKCTLIFEQL